MLTNGLRAALVVTLVLAFAVVFGLGRLMAVSIPPAPPPATPVPSGSAVENAEPSVLGEPGVDPRAIPNGAQTSVLGVPDEAGHVSLGIVAPKADYPAEPLHPSVRQCVCAWGRTSGSPTPLTSGGRMTRPTATATASMSSLATASSSRW